MIKSSKTVAAAQGDNRLPMLAVVAREAHEGVLGAAKTAAERSIEAGNALLEAKALLPHGQWLPWLREHCNIPERTAQLYMKIAESGLKSAIVADIGLKMAASSLSRLVDKTYDPFFHCPEHKNEWAIFVLFQVQNWGADVSSAWRNAEWVLQHQFNSPDEWLGDVGCQWRTSVGMRNPSTQFVQEWKQFLSDNRSLTEGEIDELLRRSEFSDRESPSRKRVLSKRDSGPLMRARE